MPTLFEMFGWDEDCRYRITGVKHENEEGILLFFDLRDTEIYITKEEDQQKKETIKAYPKEWAQGFGNPFYEIKYSHESEAFDASKDWIIDISAKGYQPEKDIIPTATVDELHQNIKEIVEELKEGV